MSTEGFTTEPNPDQPDRCPSIDPHDALQCGRRIHDDDYCRLGGIAWRKGTPRYISDAERAETRLAAVEALAAALADEIENPRFPRPGMQRRRIWAARLRAAFHADPSEASTDV